MPQSWWSVTPQGRFWFLHSLYWLLYLTLKWLNLALLLPLQDDPTWPYLSIYGQLTLIGFSVTGLLGSRDLSASYPLASQLRRLLLWLLPLYLMLMGWRHGYISQFASQKIADMTLAEVILGTTQLVLLPLAGWVALYMLIKTNQLYERQFNAQQALLAQARASRLKVLRYQLNPHFMFNTLNALNSLIVSRQGLLAEQLIQHLSTFLRHSLRNKDDSLVPITQELEALTAYLAIQQVRFGERLTLNWQIPALPRLQIPPLLLQPMAENAVLFTVAEIAGPVQLDIQVRFDDRQLHITIARPTAEPSATLVQPDWPASLTQLSERLELLFAAQASLLADLSGSHFFCQLTLPMEFLYVDNQRPDCR